MEFPCSRANSLYPLRIIRSFCGHTSKLLRPRKTRLITCKAGHAKRLLFDALYSSLLSPRPGIPCIRISRFLLRPRGHIHREHLHLMISPVNDCRLAILRVWNIETHCISVSLIIVISSPLFPSKSSFPIDGSHLWWCRSSARYIVSIQPRNEGIPGLVDRGLNMI